jgi:hypothetical protein
VESRQKIGQHKPFSATILPEGVWGSAALLLLLPCCFAANHFLPRCFLLLLPPVAPFVVAYTVRAAMAANAAHVRIHWLVRIFENLEKKPPLHCHHARTEYMASNDSHVERFKVNHALS